MKRAMPELGKNRKPRYKHIPYSVEREFMDAVDGRPMSKAVSRRSPKLFSEKALPILSTRWISPADAPHSNS